MSAPSKAIKLPPLGHQFVIFWAILCLIIIAYTDLKLPELLGQSDYLMTFHTAGYIAAYGLWPILYPPEGAISFAGAPFDKQAHILLSQMPSWSVGEYMYMPASAYIFAPLSMLAPAASIIVWQVISLTSLFAGNFLVLGKCGKAALASCAAFTLIPVVFTLWIGQVGLVFGLLPLAAGYHLLIRQRYIVAGLVFSLLTLKPQMMFPALFMAVLPQGWRRFKTLAGLVAGVLIIAGLNFALTGPAICQSWLKCLALSDVIYSDPGRGVNVQLATSLPRAILLSQPLSSHDSIKPLLLTMAAVLLLAGLRATSRLSKTSLSHAEKLTYAFLLGALALPVVVPHVFLYDLGALVPAAVLFFFNRPAASGENLALFRGFWRIILVQWLTITIYCTALVINKAFAPPLLLVAVMLACYLSGIWLAFKSK